MPGQPLLTDQVLRQVTRNPRDGGAGTRKLPRMHLKNMPAFRLDFQLAIHAGILQSLMQGMRLAAEHFVASALNQDRW